MNKAETKKAMLATVARQISEIKAEAEAENLTLPSPEEIDKLALTAAKFVEPVVLKVTVVQNGEVTVDGPLANKALCNKLIQCAREAVRDFRSLVVKPGDA